MGAAGEIVNPASLLLSAEANDADTFNNEYPMLLTPMSRQYLRTLYMSDRNVPPGAADRNLWAHLIQDVIPPRLGTIPTVDNRLPAPGGTITVTVPVYDDESGVRTVTAYFRDPDRKRYQFYTSNFDSGFTGTRALEIDSVTVGSTVLTDPEGTGVFSGTWVTQASAHDYIIDIEVTDNAGNTLRYDTLFGFSTKTFTPTSQILFVDDYCEGQQFIRQLGFTNDYAVGFSVESYYRNNPGQVEGAALGTVDFDSLAGNFGLTYDTWRVICRGRSPYSIYSIYLPTIEYQLEPEDAQANPSTAQPTRRVPISSRMVVWAAPHTGNVWIPQDSGSIVDPAVQGDITNYLTRGGKFFLSGEDIARALTMNGTVPSAFLTNTLHASFVADTPGTAVGYFESIWIGGQWRQHDTTYGFRLVAPGGDPITGAGWSGNSFDADDTPSKMFTPKDLPVTDVVRYTDAANWSCYPDWITVHSPAITLWNYASYSGATVNPPGPAAAGLLYHDEQTGQQLIYLAYGFESINRGYHTTTAAGAHCKNHRSHLITNTYIWMTTGSFQGRVTQIDGSTINDPNPVVMAGSWNLSTNEFSPRYAVRCQDDGTWVMNGIAPGGYDLLAIAPGYEMDKHDGESTNAARGPAIVDFTLISAPPGAVSGTVTSQADGSFVANVTVTAYKALPSTPPGTWTRGDQVGQSVTGADGTYSISGLPPGDYLIVADGTAAGYGTDERHVVVTAGNNTQCDFALTAAPGTLVATVRRADTDEVIPNAIVSVLANDVIVKTGVTDATGQVSIPLNPGSYAVRASASGFGQSATSGFVVESGQTVNRTLELSPAPPGSVSGRIVSATSGAPIAGITVHLKVNDVDVVPPVVSTATFTDPGTGIEPYNFRFLSAPAGEATVQPDAPGFTVNPVSRNVTIVSGQEVPSVNFSLSSLHSLAPGLQLISLPYDYEYSFNGLVDVNDPAALLGVSPSALQMATYLPLQSRYQLYPQAPADHFRLGVGYWLNLTSVADITRQGTVATDPFDIRLQPGWNLIGDPFTRSIDFTSVTVTDQTGTTMTMLQATNASPPKLQGVLFAYVLGGYHTVTALSPWVGYWLRANEPLTLHVSATAGALAAEAPAPTPASELESLTPANGWLLPLQISAGSCQDHATYLGEGEGASATYNPHMDLVKPPAADFQPFVYGSLVKDQAPGPLAVDVRSAAYRQVWDLSVKTNQVGSRVVIRWPDLSLLSNDLRPVLEDPATGQRVYMRTTGAYEFVAQQPERRLKISVVRAAAFPAVVGALTAQAAAGRVTVAYTLSSEASTTVEIRNLSGRLIRRLLSQTAQGAGLQTLTWNARNESGSLVPPGRYLITVVAVTPEGRQSQALASVWLQR